MKYDEEQLGYLLGLACGKGFVYLQTKQIAIEFAHSNEFVDGIAHCDVCGFLATKSPGGALLKCKNSRCGKQVDPSVKARYEQIRSTRQSIAESIAPFLTSGTDISWSTTGSQAITLLILNFEQEAALFEKISDELGPGRDYSTFEIPGIVSTFDEKAKWEFVNGLFDSTGYANAGSWIPRDGLIGLGRMRLYLQIVRNWRIVPQIDDFFRLELDKPVQTIDWGHPNIRDSNLQDYREQNETSWAREHQIKFYPEYLTGLSFRIKHKQAMFEELTAHNYACQFSEDLGWFPPGPIPASKRKPLHPGETDGRLPASVRKHFDAFWQIAFALDSRSLQALSLKAVSPEAWALTGDLENNTPLKELEQSLEVIWKAKSDALPESRTTKKSTPRGRTTDELEKATYAPLADALKNELREMFPDRQVSTFDTSAGNLNNFVTRLDNAQVDELAFCDVYNIRPDVVGFVEGVGEAFFIESKIETLNLKHLGQLLGYCAVAKPLRALLVSTKALSEQLVRTIAAHPEILQYAEDRAIEIAQLVGRDIKYWSQNGV